MIHLLIQPIRHPMLGIFHPKTHASMSRLNPKFIRTQNHILHLGLFCSLRGKLLSHNIPFDIVVQTRQIPRSNAHKTGPTPHRIAQIVQIGVTVNILYCLPRFHTHPTRILRNLEGLQVVIAPTMHKNAFAQTHQHPARGNIPTILHDGLTQERTRLGRNTARRIVSIRAKSADFCFIIGRKRHPTAFAIKFPQYRGR